MDIFVYRKDSETVEEGFSPDDLPLLLEIETNVVWVDFEGTSEAEISRTADVLLNTFKFHRLTVEDCIETRNQPKVESFPTYLYFIVHAVTSDANSANFATKELDGYLGKNFVVTYHNQPFESIERVKDQVRTGNFICQRGADYLLHQILDQLVDLYMPLVDEFDEVITKLEEKVFKSKQSPNQILEEIMNLRRSVARLKRISARQLEVLYRISHGEFSFIEPAHLPFFRDVHDHLLRITDLAENYRDLIGGLFDIHFNVTANKTNEITKVLTIFSAIMLPLSVIAGIYGMNFKNMPELETQYGYFVALGFMALIVIGLLGYFWWKGWIFERSTRK